MALRKSSAMEEAQLMQMLVLDGGAFGVLAVTEHNPMSRLRPPVILKGVHAEHGKRPLPLLLGRFRHGTRWRVARVTSNKYEPKTAKENHKGMRQDI